MGVQEEDMVLPEKLVFPQMIANRRKIIASQHNGREVQHEALQIAAAGKVKVITEEYKFTEVGRAVPSYGYLFVGRAAANGTSAFNHLAKLSLTDSGAISAMRLV
jgi:hypothetical protein